MPKYKEKSDEVNDNFLNFQVNGQSLKEVYVLFLSLSYIK